MSIIDNAIITSVGTAVPDNIMTNSQFEQFLDTTDEWIASRTGIKKRHIVPKDKPLPASTLGAEAARKALERVGCRPSEIDCIICTTFTPDYFFPSTACRIQNLLGCVNASAFDVSAACAGFIYALIIAKGLVFSKQCRKTLVVGSEIISKTLDWTDRSTCILFGDGAGAVLVEASEDSARRGIIESYLKSDGSLGDILVLPAWGENRTMRMKGNEVFKHAVRMMTEASRNVIVKAGLSTEDIDLFIPHQANSRIIWAVAEQLGLDRQKVVCNVERFGNTSSASIPLALDEIWTAGGIKKGTKVLFTALGGGITVGSVIVIF